MANILTTGHFVQIERLRLSMTGIGTSLRALGFRSQTWLWHA
jgi:hypothetical protein